MTMEKHRFNGFAVRSQKGGYSFCRYVSYSEKAIEGKTQADRRRSALNEAVSSKESLDSILLSKNSWGEGNLTKVAIKNITELGFRVRHTAVAG